MEWTAEAVGQWIDKDGNWSGKQFAQAQIDGKRVLALTDQDLKPLGMNARDCKEFFADTYPQLVNTSLVSVLYLQLLMQLSESSYPCHK